jgi:hypothetical protein
LQGLVTLLSFILSVTVVNKTLILHNAVKLCPEEVYGFLIWSQVTSSKEKDAGAEKRL